MFRLDYTMKNIKSQENFLGEINGVKSVIEVHQDDVTTYPILVDKNSLGKERPWREKKINNLLTSNLYRSLSDFEGDYWDKKATRLLDCSTLLLFNVLDESRHHLKLKSMNSCRVRLCPVCAWRRTLKISSHARKIFGYLEEHYPDKYSYLLLTLTVPNCPAETLSDTITHLMKSFDRLFKRKEVKNIVRGWYRGLEVTHNHNLRSNSYDTYHPHFHVLLVVDKNYLDRFDVSRGYISHDRWLKLWQECCRDESITQVDIRTVKPKKVKSPNSDNLSSSGLLNAICEITKYTVKDKDYILPWDWELSQDIVKTLDNALANRRLVAWGGVLKEIKSILCLDDEVDGDLVNIDDAPDDGVSVTQILAFWHTGFQQYIVKP